MHDNTKSLKLLFRIFVYIISYQNYATVCLYFLFLILFISDVPEIPADLSDEFQKCCTDLLNAIAPISRSASRLKVMP